MKKMSIPMVAITALVYMVVAQVIHTISSILTMGYYTAEQYFPVWSKVMMPNAGPPPASFYVYALLYAFIGGLMFVIVYNVVKESIPGKSALKKGVGYGVLAFAIAGIPMTLTLHLLINLPAALIVAWAFEGLVIYVLNGIITAKINK